MRTPFVKLMDVSFWQDDDSTPQMVDFAKAKAAGIQGCYIKVSQTTYLDKDYLLNWKHAKDAGMPRGGYHYLNWTHPLVEQVRFFCGVLKNDPGEMTPCLNYECRIGVPSAGNARQQLHDSILEFEDKMGMSPLLYTGLDYWKNWGSVDQWWLRCKLWFAYPTERSYDPPPPPLPWTSWWILQYSWKGDGIKFGCESKQVDLDEFGGTEEEYLVWIGGMPVPPPPPPAGKTINSRGMQINIRNRPEILPSTDVGDALLTKADVIEDIPGFYAIKVYAAKSVTSLNP